jgi:hypothetical protein
VELGLDAFVVGGVDFDFEAVVAEVVVVGFVEVFVV